MTAHTASPEIDLVFLRACLKEAGDIALVQRGQMTAEIKPDLTPVTAVDRQVETFLIERITSRYPGHQILSEESGLKRGLNKESSAYSWIIDPIDGTRAFASGLPIWGISIGILRDGEPYAGGLYMPVTGDMFWGTPQQGYWNDRLLPRLQFVDPDSVLVFLAVPSDVHLHFRIAYPRIRSLGSTAAHLAYAAAGVAVGVLTHHIGLWDIAGLLPALTATGIVITTLSGKPFHPADMMDGRMAPEPLLIAHPTILGMLRDRIQQNG